jgi:hypothetical protein
MSCTFWLRRKKLAALKAAEAAKQATDTETEKVAEQATDTETEKVAEKKPAKKGGAKKNDNEATV